MTKKVVQLLGLDSRNNKFSHKSGESFFKPENTRYSRYGSEYLKIPWDSSNTYGEEITFSIPLTGDILHKCILEIEVPDYIFKDTNLYNTNIDYKKIKDLKIKRFTTKIDDLQQKYINFKAYSKLQISIYYETIRLFSFENLTLITLQTQIKFFINNNLSPIENENLIDTNIILGINISQYIEDLTTINNIEQIKSNLKKMFDNINKYLNYYYSNLIYYKKKLAELRYGEIKYKWIDDLSEHYFTNYELLINELSIDEYSNDTLHLINLSRIQNSAYNYYIDSIGNNLNNKTTFYDTHTHSFDSDNIIHIEINDAPLKKNIIYTPLLFWFCECFQNSLPLVSLDKNTIIKIKLLVNRLQNLIYFQDYEKEYDEYLSIDIPLEDHSKNSNNTIIEKSDLNYTSVELILPEYIYRYRCTEINKSLLMLQFPDLVESQADIIFNVYGSLSSIDSTSKVLALQDWVKLKKDIHKGIDQVLSKDSQIIISGGDYKNIIDYNSFLNRISHAKPNINLIIQIFFIDNVDRNILAKTEQTLLIRKYNELNYPINNRITSENLELTGLIDNIYYFLKPKLFTNGIIYKYGKTLLSKYKNFNLIQNTDKPYIDNFVLNMYDESSIILKSESTFYHNYVIPYLYLDGFVPDGVYYKNICLYPFDENPSGTINSDVLGQSIFNLTLNQNFFNSYFDTNINPDNIDIDLKIIYTHLSYINIKNGYIEILK
uniref:Major capsid protein n=1 Tax=Megaviridae environmental sample TaxID=1737588 RepID=A0A5J6VLC5_9VIRU|nr:MAG: hypothetical protein [Megaviridae environmental sample]